MPTFSSTALVKLAESLFVAAGVPAADAATVANSLVDANLCGHDSHGFLRIPQYLDFIKQGIFKPGAPLTILNETPAVIAADGNWGLGQVQAFRLLNKLLEKASVLGIAAGTIKQCGHIGRLGEYAETAARQRMAFIGAVNSHGGGRRVVPPNGTEGRISTNPICMGAPTSTDPVVLDFGTCTVAEGKVRQAFQKKEPVPEGWLVDHQGQPTTDPGVLYAEPRGNILPFGGAQMYKGFGLGLMVDLLCGGLSGGPCSSPKFQLGGQGNAVVFIVVNPALLGGAEHFVHETDGLTEYVRSCPTAAGAPPITLPGDPERTAKQKRLAEGIPIPDGTWELIAKAARELNVPLPA
ncbi:MAG TPA: Ldh family oxidoreductase [Gemmataceae bacterium]